MADPLLYPDNLNAYLRDLEARIRQLEATNRLLSSAIAGGALSVYDGAGVRQIVLGQQTDGSYGILVGANLAVPGLRLDDVNGLSYPQLPIQFGPGRSTTVTAPVLTEYCTATWVGIAHRGIYVRLLASTAVGTTGEVQLIRNGGAGTSTSVITIPSDSFLLTVEFWFLHAGTLGGTYKFSLQARRASGAGAFIIEDPNFAAMVGPQHCSTTGAFVP